MTRHGLAEILLMVLAVCGALAICSLIGTRLLQLTARSTPPGTGGVAFTVGGVSTILFSVLIVVLVGTAVALAVFLRSRR